VGAGNISREEKSAETTTPPLEKITTFHTETSSPSSISRQAAIVIVAIDAINRDNTDDVNGKHGGMVRT